MSFYNRDEASQDLPRRAFLLGLIQQGQPGHLVEEHLDELAELARSAGVEVAGNAIQRRATPHPATFVGRGKAEEAGQAAKELGADLLLFDDDLSPSQVKNLEKIVELQVMDRSGLILEIFSQRARTREARTQVELARLRYVLPRLTRMWKHLSRQGGGVGIRGGEGEKQIEADRRILRNQIGRLEKQLKKIERTRSVQRRGRRGTLSVALAGYTNAGKTTLFNRLTGAGEKAQNLLFATLDARLRKGALAPGRIAVFADTVGFIRKLPHHLVSSFRSTLEEATAADLVLHVIDRSHPIWEDQANVAEDVLAELGVEPERLMRVYNKADRLFAEGASWPAPVDNEGVWVSALSGEGLDVLKEEILKRAELLGQPVPSAWPEPVVAPAEAVVEGLPGGSEEGR
ncbi:MAG: GTPase HflX [Acidobacteriota bacterium]